MVLDTKSDTVYRDATIHSQFVDIVACGIDTVDISLMALKFDVAIRHLLAQCHPS